MIAQHESDAWEEAAYIRPLFHNPNDSVVLFFSNVTDRSAIEDHLNSCGWHVDLRFLGNNLWRARRLTRTDGA